MSKSVQVTIGPTGEIRIEAIGFKGNACEKATAEIEKMLGVGAKRTKKPEFYAAATAGQRERA